jgi:hypothetical protein
MSSSNILTAINAITGTNITVNGVVVKGIKPADMPSQIHITPCHFIPMTAVQVNIQQIGMGGRTRYEYTLRHLMLWKALAQNSIDDAFPELLAWIQSYNDKIKAISLPTSIAVQSVNVAETAAITYPIAGEVTFAGVETPIVLVESV